MATQTATTHEVRPEEVNARYEWHEVKAAHACLRDEGPRCDPALFLRAIGWMLSMFDRTLAAARA
jgi:carboxymethylenebutenolidase